MARQRQLSPEERAERAAAKLAAAQELLASEVSALRSGEDWQRALAWQAKLHRYSPNNALLIWAQHLTAHREGRVPASEPTYVAGFHTWKALGRSVIKGQHGYGILAPVAGVRRLAVDASGEARQLERGEHPGAGEVEQRHRILRGFRIETVFDVSQTAGVELPEPPVPNLLLGEAPTGLREAAERVIVERGFTIGTVPDAAALGGANGRTDWAATTVEIRSDMDDAAQVKTLVHEAAHVLLHDDLVGRGMSRRLKEVEAESVAYLVSAVHGMPTDGYTFPYVAAWAGDDPSAVIASTQRRVASAAQLIIEASPAPCLLGGRPPGADTIPSARPTSTPAAAPAATASDAATISL